VFQINTTHGGSEAFDYLLYGDSNPINQDYFKQQIQNFSNSLNEAGRRFFEGSRELYNRINDSAIAERARLAVRKAMNIFNPNAITELDSLASLRTCQPVMQRYMMAMPEIRELFHQQRCDGYSDSYQDLYPGRIGADHYDYRRVMSGVVQAGEEGEPDFSCRIYMDDLLPEDRELTHSEKVDILHSWELARIFLNQSVDPTSIFDGSIG
jgi:hypothetical protein